MKGKAQIADAPRAWGPHSYCNEDEGRQGTEAFLLPTWDRVSRAGHTALSHEHRAGKQPD